MENNYNFSNKNEFKKTFMIIETNKEYYFKGETIEGNIILDCLSNITLKEISISLYLNENWLIQETSSIKYGEKNNQLISKFDIGVSKILNDNNETKTLFVGKYIFPFKIELPNYLEPSFEYPLPNRSAYLRYLLESEIISNSLKLKSHNYILIKSSIKKLIAPKAYSSIANVHKWGILDGGSTILKVSYNKNNYKIDEIVPLHVEIDNHRGKIKVKECKVRIIRTIQFSRLDKDSLEKYPLEKTILSKVFSSEVFPNSKRSFIFQSELKDKDLIDLNYLNVNNPDNPYPNIKDMNILLPSIEGGIIKCDYRIQVSLYFDSFVTSGYRPRVSLPIIITHQFQDENDIQNESNLNNEIYINDTNKYNNLISASSLLFDKNYYEKNNQNKNSIINNNNFNVKNDNIIYKINNENEKNNNQFYDINYMIKFSQREDEKNNVQNEGQISNKKPNYIELNEESYYNINEI